MLSWTKQLHILSVCCNLSYPAWKAQAPYYSGADKSLARPGRKQANVSVRMAWISFGALPCRKKKTWLQLASRCRWNRALPWYVSELVSFLVGLRTYQHAGIFSSVASLSLPYFSTSSHKRQDREKEKKRVFLFSLQLQNIYDSKKTSSSYYHKCKLHKSSCKVPVIDTFSSGTQISNFMTICTVGVEFLHADRRRDTTKLIVAVRNSENAYKN